MQTIRKPVITKSDFMLFLEAPLHLWAKKHGRYAKELSDFDQHLIRQGYEVESLARQYFFQVMPGIDYEMKWQQTYIDGSFEVRTDALLYKPVSNSYDLYEIKSRTVLDKEDIYDLTFQALVLESQITVDRYYVLHLNKEYIRADELELAQLFVAEDVTDKVEALKLDVMTRREQALQVTLADNPETMEHCFTPKVCPCPDVCHPDLPEFSIYDIPYLRKPAKQTLLAMGIQSAKDVPGDFFLNEKQRLVVEMAKTNQEQINQEAIREQLDTFTYPIYFLDYETCICAIPPFTNYHPQQQVVFQYSLHRLDKPDGELRHIEHLSIIPGDPAPSLLKRLRQDIGDTGTVIAWNKVFEQNCNTNLAAMYPEYAQFLDAVNERMYDLGDMINFGYFLLPGFKGSWSLKNVLPVMVPELSYAGMEIGEGGQASVAWWNIQFGQLSEEEKNSLSEALLRYCELDTLAMVEIFKVLNSI